MVGTVIAIMKGYVNASIIEKAMQKEKMLMPQAPGLGLVLDSVHYDKYNQRYEGDGIHVALNYEDEAEQVEEFFRKHILSTIIETELKEESMLRWVGKLKNHPYDPNDERYKHEVPENDGNESD